MHVAFAYMHVSAPCLCLPCGGEEESNPLKLELDIALSSLVPWKSISASPLSLSSTCIFPFCLYHWHVSDDT